MARPAGGDDGAVCDALDSDVEAVTCAIPGAKRPGQVEENTAAADFPPLEGAAMAAINDIYEKSIKPLVHHYW